MKFFTILFFSLATIISSQAQGIKVFNQKKNKLADVPLHNTIEFSLFSDSVLQLNYLDQASVISYTDSSLILNDNREILLSDFKTIVVFPKKKHKLKGVAVGFLFAGIGFLIKGVVMASAEGLKSKNKELTPLYIGSGLALTTISSIPFWGQKKKYILAENKWQFIIQ